ncbi:MAG: twin-arginine translocation signal domain-containing protein, partial [Bacteroidetes bacterium]
MDRRTFLKAGAVAGMGATVGGPRALGQAAPAVLRRRGGDVARLGFIGVGLRGREHLRLALQRDDVEVTALCDVDAGALAEARKLIEAAGRPLPPVYTGSDHAYLDLLARDDVD